MTGKVKALGLAFLAIAAIGGVTASAASAQAQIHVKDMGKIHAHGTQIGTTAFGFPEGSLACSQAKFTFHTAYKINPEQGKQEDVETTATTFTVKTEEGTTPLEPETIHCTFGGLGGTLIHMNGCDFDLHINTLKTKITCPANQQITYTVIVGGVLKCTIHIPEQGDLETFKVTNNATKQDVNLTFEISKITYTMTPGQGLGACTKTEDGKDGKFTGEVTVECTASGIKSDCFYE